MLKLTRKEKYAPYTAISLNKGNLAHILLSFSKKLWNCTGPQYICWPNYCFTDEKVLSGTKFTEIFVFFVLKLWTPLLLKVQTRTTLEQNMMPIKNKQLRTIKKITITTRSRSSRSQMFVKIGVRKGLQACNLNKKSLQHRCFPVDFAKLIRTAFL